MAQWIHRTCAQAARGDDYRRRLSPEEEIPGSSPGRCIVLPVRGGGGRGTERRCYVRHISGTLGCDEPVGFIVLTVRL